MRQLSGHDASFLYADSSHANANVTLIHIYDQSTAPGGVVRFKSILAHIERRLDRSPVFRQRLMRVPLDLDNPYWVDDEHFDLEYHVRHIALPKPGDWRQFCIQASRIHARPLDMSRPLWEAYVIEGLDSFLDLPAGSFALLTKTHLAALDLEQGNELTMLLHDLSPEPGPAAPPAPWFPERPPRSLPVVGRGMLRSIKATAQLATPLARALRDAVPAAAAVAGDLLRAEGPPVTRFNAVVSPHRVFETRRFTLDEFRAIRAAVPGSNVHDAVLAVCGGALRRYLEHHGELPEASLTALTPISVTSDADEGAGSPGRGLAWLHVPLGTQLADPLERLRSIHAHTASSDVIRRAVGAREIADVARLGPAAALALASKFIAGATRALGRRAPPAHCAITNVPGPAMPLYLCGARMSYFSAIMPIADGLGLSVAVTSYDGRIIVSPTSCRELMPDPEFFAQCVRDSFQELLAAAQGVPVASQKARRRASVTVKPAAAADRTPAPKAARTAPRRASARTAGPAR
jgi:diacylglycerol O-acyltransferase